MNTTVLSGTCTGSPEQVSNAILARFRDAHFTPQALLLFASTRCPLEQLVALLERALPDCKLVGASSAGEFTERSECSGCVAFFALAGELLFSSGWATQISADPVAAVSSAVASLPPLSLTHPHRTVLVFFDTFSGQGEETALLLSAMLGENVVLAGAAAADERMQRSVVAAGANCASDALALLCIDARAPVGIGVAHGHTPMSAPLRVTKAAGNQVYSIEGRPAWRVWVEHTRQAALANGTDPLLLDSPESFMQYLVLYEAGLSLGREFKVRAPLRRDADDSLSFACGIPEGAIIRIMQSSAEAQLDSARKAAQLAKERVGAPIAGALAFDCVCRKLILKDDFIHAVRAISDVIQAPLAGFETFGEVALSVGEMSGFHNTTTVVVAFPEST